MTIVSGRQLPVLSTTTCHPSLCNGRPPFLTPSPLWSSEIGMNYWREMVHTVGIIVIVSTVVIRDIFPQYLKGYFFSPLLRRTLAPIKVDTCLLLTLKILAPWAHTSKPPHGELPTQEQLQGAQWFIRWVDSEVDLFFGKWPKFLIKSFQAYWILYYINVNLIQWQWQ